MQFKFIITNKKLFCEMLEFNSCLLAKLIHTKTCRQVYEFMKLDPTAAPHFSKPFLFNPNLFGSDNGSHRHGDKTDEKVHKHSHNNSHRHNSNHHSHDYQNNHHNQAKSRRQPARKTHFLAHKLHEAAAEEESVDDMESESDPLSKSRKRKHSKNRARAGMCINRDNIMFIK